MSAVMAVVWRVAVATVGILLGLLIASVAPAQVPPVEPAVEPAVEAVVDPDGPGGELPISGLSFDGGDGANASSSALNFATSDFAVGAWVKPGSVTANQILIAKRNSGGGTAGWRLYLSDNKVGFLFDADGLNYYFSAAGVVSIGTWTHVVVAADRDGNLVLYLNGVATTTGDFPADISGKTATVSNTNALGFGQVTGLVPYTGILVNPFGMNRLPTAGEISNLMTAMTPENSGIVGLWNQPGYGTSWTDVVSGYSATFLAGAAAPTWVRYTSIGSGGPQ